jgi:hypothetical protein
MCEQTYRIRLETVDAVEQRIRGQTVRLRHEHLARLVKDTPPITETAQIRYLATPDYLSEVRRVLHKHQWQPRGLATPYIRTQNIKD